MFIAYGVKKYRDHKKEKEAQANGEAIPENGQKAQKPAKAECPSCHETKKIDFTTTPGPEHTRTATCMKCGTQWRYL